MYVKIAIVLVALATSAYANVISAGQCPDVTGVANFDNTLFLGNWYQFAVKADTASTSDCVTYLFEDVGQDITTVQFAARSASGTVEEYGGTYTNDPTNPAKINLVLVSAGFVGTTYITYVDYESYAVLYHCENVDSATKDESLWILSRAATATNARASSFLSEYIEMTDFITPLVYTSQNSCPAAIFAK